MNYQSYTNANCSTNYLCIRYTQIQFVLVKTICVRTNVQLNVKVKLNASAVQKYHVKSAVVGQDSDAVPAASTAAVIAGLRVRVLVPAVVGFMAELLAYVALAFESDSAAAAVAAIAVVAIAFAAASRVRVDGRVSSRLMVSLSLLFTFTRSFASLFANVGDCLTSVATVLLPVA